MARYLIDTDVMIDVSRRNAAAATYVDSLDEIAISIITAHELIVGARNQRDADGIDSLVKTYPVQADLDARITGRAYQLLKRHARSDGLRTFDALIAATGSGLTAGARFVEHPARAYSATTAPLVTHARPDVSSICACIRRCIPGRASRPPAPVSRPARH